MSLDKYYKKRKFNQTPEPKGTKLKGSGPLTFVVQKHAATGLHYDFRLELDGVLKSWAVPKGPSLNPEDKRLAMMVEDHPMEYASFEGIIPKGNYGAGTVMVWDNGVYSPYETVERGKAEEILNEQLEKGHLTFIMLGKKLKGEFALVKAPKAGENAWLLIKKGDEFASKEDILKGDKSVLTGRSMDEIKREALKKEEIWYSRPKDLNLDDAPKGDMPHDIKPMLAEEVDEAFDKKDWIFEMKLDGFRTVAEIESGKVKLYSRNKQEFNEKFSEVAKSLEKFPGNAVLDGEIVVIDPAGKPVFQLLQDYHKSKQGELTYFVFDILYYGGYNLESLPLLRRKGILRQILPPIPHVRFNDHIEEIGTEFFREISKMGLEGIMAKNAESSYKEGFRSHNWLKIKTQNRQEAVIGGFTSPNGGRKHIGALVLGIYKNGKLVYIGHVGGGFNEKSLEEVYSKLKPLEQDDCPFDIEPETNAPVTWVKPKLVVDVTFSNWTNDHQMRHPIFIGLRDDKSADEVDEQKHIRIFSKEAPGKEESTETKIGGQTLKLTNLSKIFWPEEKYTKGDLISYYKKVAHFILPHLKDRPQSLLRYPNGIYGESFFHKDAGDLAPDWMKTVKVHSDSGEKDIKYLLCQDEASLIYLINLGCIDLNPWNSGIKNLDNPNYLIIDLDPEDTGFENVVKVTLATRKVLENLEIKSFPKTSGSRGMHIYIPMGAKYSYEQTRRLAELLCIQIQHELPHITSMVRDPKKRQGKVYLDFLQNIKGQTLASVYSVRAKPGATVSTPLKWSEVTEKLHPSQFTIKNIPKRVQSHGDLFKGVLGEGIAIEKILRNLEQSLNS